MGEGKELTVACLMASTKKELAEALIGASETCEKLRVDLAQRDEQITGLTEALAEAEDGTSGPASTQALDAIESALFDAFNDDGFKGTPIELAHVVCAALAETRDKLEGAVQIAENFEQDANNARKNLKKLREKSTGAWVTLALHGEVVEERRKAKDDCEVAEAELLGINAALDEVGILDPAIFTSSCAVLARVKLVLAALKSAEAGCQGDSKSGGQWISKAMFGQLKSDRVDAQADLSRVVAELRTINNVLDSPDVLELQGLGGGSVGGLELSERVSKLAARCRAEAARETEAPLSQEQLAAYEDGAKAKGFVLCEACAKAVAGARWCPSCLQNMTTIHALMDVREELEKSDCVHAEEVEKARKSLVLMTEGFDNEREHTKRLAATVRQHEHTLQGVSLGVAMALGKVNQ